MVTIPVSYTHLDVYKRQVRHLAEHSVKDAMDAFEHSGEVMAQASRTMIATMNPLELPHHLESALDLVRHPTCLLYTSRCV